MGDNILAKAMMIAARGNELVEDRDTALVAKTTAEAAGVKFSHFEITEVDLCNFYGTGPGENFGLQVRWAHQ